MTIVGSYHDELTRDLDIVRSMLGDTNIDALLLSDDHILAVLAREGSVNRAAAFCARELLARFASQPTSASANGVSVNYASRLEVWNRLVGQLDIGATPARSSWSMVRVNWGSVTDDEYSRGSGL